MERFENVRLRADALILFIEALFERAGTDRASAEAVARACVDASARGYDTHGVRLVPHYLRGIAGGRINPRPRVSFTRSAAAIGHVDADDGLGHLASYRAIDEGIAIAREAGVAAVAVGRSSHHGATGCYAIEAARRGFAALGMTHADAIVVPHGGVKALLRHQPVELRPARRGRGAPAARHGDQQHPLNRVLLRRATSTALPPDVAVDEDGVMTTDPHRAAAVLSLGGLNFGYKGAGLACMIDLLCSAFTGMAHGFLAPPFGGPDFATPTRLGHFFVVLRPDLFQPADQVPGERVRPGPGPARPAGAARMRVMAPSDPEKARGRRSAPGTASRWISPPGRSCGRRPSGTGSTRRRRQEAASRDAAPGASAGDQGGGCPPKVVSFDADAGGAHAAQDTLVSPRRPPGARDRCRARHRPGGGLRPGRGRRRGLPGRAQRSGDRDRRRPRSGPPAGRPGPCPWTSATSPAPRRRSGARTVQVLVNNAGTNKLASFAEAEPEDFDAVFALNVRAAFFAAQAVARGLIAAEMEGSIIHMSSQMGHVGGPRRSVYCATKHALEGITKASAIDLGPHRIRVNTLCPTFIETPLTRPILAEGDFRQVVLEKIKLGRLGKVEDLMGAILYLAGDASALVTGTSLLVDGGWTAD
jgi:LDH2 family malate/lactate/ureidoglycolate dehydrogenase/NAD(P)-dependent dehydrogenase (short-subunit alcohol dehydrogenase family)